MWPSKRSAIAVNPFRFKAIRAVTSLLGQTAFWIPVDIGSPPQAPLCFLQQRRRLLLGPLRPAIALVSEPDSCREVESRLLKNYALIHSFMRARSRRSWCIALLMREDEHRATLTNNNIHGGFECTRRV